MASKLVQGKGQRAEYSEKVLTAARFLGRVYHEGYEESGLRKYLVEKRDFTGAEVDMAFKIYQQEKVGLNKKRQEQVESSTPQKAKKLAEPSRKSSDTYGISLSYLKPENQAMGAQLVDSFLEAEETYCTVLDCLKDEYYKQLRELSANRRISLTPGEVDRIFQRIPKLVEFHRSFHKDVLKGAKIGRAVVSLYRYFVDYINYMKNCKVTIETMRKYIHDEELSKFLVQIREKSKRKNNDMVGLMLIPLDRIWQYKVFLEKLLEWADEKNAREDFTLLAKAARRVSGVANYIGKYKHAISNMNEMNKVQQYLGKQINIISDNRRLIHRGTMTRRTTGFGSRNKKYIFFLFNDILLWTTRSGDLQNFVYLEDCDVMPSDAKRDSERKLRVVCRGKKWKRLLLECEIKRMRDDWYKSLTDTILRAKNRTTRARNVQKRIKNKENEDSSEDTFDPLYDKALIAHEAFKGRLSNDGEDDFHTQIIPSAGQFRTDDEEESVQPIEEQKDDCEYMAKLMDTEKIPDIFEQLEENCEYSVKLIDQEMKEFAIFDDQESQNSEFDREFLHQHLQSRVEVKEEEISSIDMLNPFRMRTNSREEVPKGRRSSRSHSRQRSRGQEERGSVDAKVRNRRSKSSFDGVKRDVPLRLERKAKSQSEMPRKAQTENLRPIGAFGSKQFGISRSSHKRGKSAPVSLQKPLRVRSTPVTAYIKLRLDEF